MNARTLYEAIGQVDEKYLDLVDAPKKETENMKHPHVTVRKTLTYLFAAAIAISLLTVTASAARWIPGLFNLLKERYPQDKELFAAAALANTDAVPEIMELPHLDLSKFTLFERYFDGETILIGYDLDIVLPEPVVGIAPNAELLEKIKNGTSMTSISWSDIESWHTQPDTENAAKHSLSAEAAEMDRMLIGTLTEAAYQKVWSLMEKQGYVCIAVRNAWLGDHILINGIDTAEAYLESNAYADRTEYTSELGNCIRMEPLPDDVSNLEQITVTLSIKSSLDYWYMDMDGNGKIYYDYSDITTDQVSFELNRIA